MVHIHAPSGVCLSLTVPSPFTASLFSLESAFILAPCDHSNCPGVFLNAGLVPFMLVM